MKRRELLRLATAAGVAGTLPTRQSHAADVAAASLPIVDTNLSLFHWPFRRLPLDEPKKLVAKLRSLGITQGWTGSYEGLLHRDLGSVNQRLSEVCRQYPELVPVGSINPVLPGWREDLQACAENRQMPGIRLHPNYHGYSLEDTFFHELLDEATKANLFVQIAVSMEDDRTQSSLVQVPDVDLTSLPGLMAGIKSARVQLLNLRLRPAQLEPLKDISGLHFDIARIDGTDGVPMLMNLVGEKRVLFGTNTPFLISEAALIRMHESGRLNRGALRRLVHENAQEFLQAGTS